MQESLEPEAGIGEELIEPKAEESRVPGSGRNIYDILYGNIGKKASYPALIYYGRRVTYFQLISAVDSFAAELESRTPIRRWNLISTREASGSPLETGSRAPGAGGKTTSSTLSECAST